MRKGDLLGFSVPYQVIAMRDAYLRSADVRNVVRSADSFRHCAELWNEDVTNREQKPSTNFYRECVDSINRYREYRKAESDRQWALRHGDSFEVRRIKFGPKLKDNGKK